MWYDGEWEKKRSRDTSHKAVAESVLKSYGEFIEDYTSHLIEIEESLHESLDFTRNPLNMKWAPREDVSFLELLDSDNKVLDKVLVVFTSLVTEVKELYMYAGTNFIQPILFYGEGLDDNNVLEGDAQVMISRLLPTLQDLVTFLSRLYAVLLQLVQQICAFYTFHGGTTRLRSVADTHLPNMFDAIGSILLMLIMFDELFSNQSTLTSHWNLYRRTVKTAIQNQPKLGVDINQLKRLDKLLNEINTNLFTSKCLNKALNLPFEKRGQVKKNNVLAEKMNTYIKNTMLSMELRTADMYVMLKWTKLCATYVLSATLFGTTDKKLYKSVWETSKKHHSVTLFGNVLWLPDKFLVNNLSHLTKQLIDKKTLESVAAARQTFLSQAAVYLPKELNLYSTQTCMWVTRFETALKQDLDYLEYRHLTDLFLEGVHLMGRMKRLVSLLINLHGYLGKPMTKGSALILCKFVEIIKGIEMMYWRHFTTISKHMSQVVHQLCYRALIVITATKKVLLQDKKYMEKVDILSSLVMAEKALDGPPTKLRLIIVIFSLALANVQQTFREDDYLTLFNIMTSLRQVESLQENLAETSRCDFLYWHKVILPTYFDRLSEVKSDLQKMIYMMNAVQDNEDAVHLTKHLSDTNTLLNAVDEEILRYLNTKLIGPLCQEIETNLRLQIHSHLKNEELTLKNLTPDCANLLDIQPFFLFHKYVNLKARVEAYLQRTFYDLTTVALHDWRTYGEMRSLAKYKYNLTTVEDNLPSQTLEQGLDVLEIMRNIHIFVSKYMYNLNNQIFIESSSNNKHLNTINIRHIANSIRTHGTGIMNTTVNFTYQFLRKKLEIFSQFLYDDHIKSMLLKEMCYFHDNKTQLDSKYPYDRAVKFNKDIRALGTLDGVSYLDKFRLLITHIGNAMGYVRMIRSGGLHCCSNAIRFIPDLENIIKFEELTLEEDVSETCQQAASGLDHVVSNLARNLTEGTEYFKLLVDVFAPVFRDRKKNNHLRNFHMIVPALIINFCETMVTSKEKLSKKSKEGAAFTDDGFAMGIAYMLKVIDLNSEFDSLHWFQSVGDRYHSRRTKTEQKRAASVSDDKLQQTLNLTLKRILLEHQEFSLLYYSLSSARIFFQRDPQDVKSKEQENKPAENTKDN